MGQEDLVLAVGAQPFVPLRLHMSNGSIYNVTHPDGIMVRERVSAIAIGDSIQLVANAHVNAVEPVVR